MNYTYIYSKNFVLSTVMKKILEILEIRNIYIGKWTFLNPCIFAIYPIEVRYVAIHRGKGDTFGS